jgi:uncharacterized protein (DUF2147 family)
MYLRSFLLAALLGLAFSAGAHAAPKLDPAGVWLVEDATARVRIEHCGLPADKICGYLVWAKDPGQGADALDTKNPDPKKQGRPVVGAQLILGLSPEDEDYAGSLYNAENGKMYDVKVWRTDATHLTLKGCVMKILCQSQAWTKVDDVAPGQLNGPTDGVNGPRADAEWASAPVKVSAMHKTKH